MSPRAAPALGLIASLLVASLPTGLAAAEIPVRSQLGVAPPVAPAARIGISAGSTAAPSLSLATSAARTPSQAAAEDILSLVARSQVLQSKVPGFVDAASRAIEAHGGALPAEYSVRIAREIGEANSIRASLFRHALANQSALYRVDMGLADGDRIDSILIAMAAALTLFDNSQFMQQQFSDDRVLRGKLNEAYPEEGVGRNFYADSVLRANSLAYRATMSGAIRFFQNNHQAIAQHVAVAGPGIRALYDFVDKSPVRSRSGGDDVFRMITDQVGVLVGRSAAESFKQAGKLKFLTSKVVGNTMGLVRWRAGKLKGDREMLAVMAETLQPGDILLEKTPFALTDKTIPGHFGHVAVYVGTVAQLRAMGALELPVVRKHLKAIESGHVVLEALRGGVVLNTLEHFMNVDDVAVLRAPNQTPDAIKNSVGLALSNFGKRYDFAFDVNTTETIVCSELAYVSYPQIDFATKQVFTSFTISPDDIAKLASGRPADPLTLALFAHKGKLAYRNGDADEAGAALYRRLLGSESKARSERRASGASGPPRPIPGPLAQRPR